MDLKSVNDMLRGVSAPAVVEWALAQGRPTIATTSMAQRGAHAAPG